MDTINALKNRGHSKCELCLSENDLEIYQVPPRLEDHPDNCVLLCQTCQKQIKGSVPLDPNHWRCLNQTMWSEFPPVQVMVWRILTGLKDQVWAQELKEQLYLEDDVKNWADSYTNEESTPATNTTDAHGNILMEGDTVTLIKDLEVKGANFTAKRGTVVKKISLTENPEQIEGRVNGTQIVLLTRFLKKAT